MKKIILLFLIFCFINYCSYCTRERDTFAYNHIINTISSPNGNMKAVVYLRDLGATTRKSYHLSILKSNQKIRNSGNTYVSYQEFEVKWISNDILQVVVMDNENTLKQENVVDDVQIEYRCK